MDHALFTKRHLDAESRFLYNPGNRSTVRCLMEHAAQKTIEVMERENIDFSDILIVCGSGNNGGDGFAIARLLQEKGVRVTVFFAGKEVL